MEKISAAAAVLPFCREYTFTCGLRFLCVPAIDSLAEAHIAKAQVVIGDPAAACKQLEGELHGFQHEVAFDGLEVGLALGGGALEDLDDRLALQLVGVERGFQVGVLFERARQRYSILHRQLRARPD